MTEQFIFHAASTGFVKKRKYVTIRAIGWRWSPFP